VISVSRTVADQFQRIGAPNERITVIPNGVDLEEYNCLPRKDAFRKRLRIRDDRKILLTIGRLERIKGFQYLIEALPKVLEKVSVDLIVGGPEFNYGAQLRKLAKERKVDDHVVFYGPMNQKEKLEAMAAADAIVVPSLYEGFGIVLLEAMAAGKPVVATTTGVAREVIRDGRNGFLIPPGDARTLAEKLCRLLTDNRLSSLISRQSRKAVKVFSWKTIAAETLEVYERCLSAQGRIMQKK
jgi:glycosyltransferase involved in cell wall biosynthesis